MAKKKTKNKKHSFKYAEPTLSASDRPVSQPVAGSRPASPVATTRDFSYLPVDLRRLAIFASGLVVVELVLWYLFGHTSLGSTVDGLIKL